MPPITFLPFTGFIVFRSKYSPTHLSWSSSHDGSRASILAHGKLIEHGEKFVAIILVQTFSLAHSRREYSQ
jgi:hypothetical protein